MTQSYLKTEIGQKKYAHGFRKTFYCGGQGSWTKSKNSGPFWFTMNPTVKFHRSNFNFFFGTKYKNNQKMKTQAV